MSNIQLIQGNCLEKLKELDDNSVDSIVTDPPYGLSFMGKKWDYDVPTTELWEEALRVLKPGGHLLAFFGTRTYHRGVVRIEDAGFEIRDMVSWVYASGFPKSHNIGKAVDKLQGNEREVVDKKPVGYAGLKRNANLTDDNWKGITAEDTGLEVTKGNSPWEGWGTALKPAVEPIVVARKPLSEKSVAKNVLKWGTGGINIDECRVGTEEIETGRAGRKSGSTFNASIGEKTPPAQGRFPANFIHDNSDEVVGLFPETKPSKKRPTPKNDVNDFNVRDYNVYAGGYKPKQYEAGHNDNDGSAARFFYCAKASKSERNAGLEGFEEKSNMRVNAPRNNEEEKHSNKMSNFHPTVKPVKLMQYLVRLVTPKGGTVLDPFMGSGSTGIASKKEGFDFIGIEREAEYIKIAEARIEKSL